MRYLVVLGVIVCALSVPTLAAGGGWATVGFEPLPDGMSAGGTWKPDIFVKQHGVTPLAGLQPVVMIEETASGQTTTFPATADDEAGLYHADVVFPSQGDWRITILSGFGDSQATYGPVAIGAPADGGASEPRSLVGFGVVALAVLGAFGVVVGRRTRRLTPASG
jgi:hypothetical protein